MPGVPLLSNNLGRFKLERPALFPIKFHTLTRGDFELKSKAASGKTVFHRLPL